MRRTIRGARGIVTGASSGIGRALAVELGRRGARLVVTARRIERLQVLADEIRALGAHVVVVGGDITDASTRRELAAAASNEFGGLDILVNNAGLGAWGPFGEASPQRLRQIMEVNFFAPAELVRDALPLLRAGQRPIIVNMSSVLGHRAVPRKSEYCASKFALHGLSDAIRCELRSSAIDVLLISPSTTDTEFFDSVLDGPAAGRATAAASSARWVARQTVAAIEKGRHEVILSAGGKFLVWLDRLWPALADRLVARFG